MPTNVQLNLMVIPPNKFDLKISAIKKKLAMMKAFEIREILSK